MSARVTRRTGLPSCVPGRAGLRCGAHLAANSAPLRRGTYANDAIQQPIRDLALAHQRPLLVGAAGLDERDLVGVGAKARAFLGDVVGDHQVHALASPPCRAARSSEPGLRREADDHRPAGDCRRATVARPRPGCPALVRVRASGPAPSRAILPSDSRAWPEVGHGGGHHERVGTWQRRQNGLTHLRRAGGADQVDAASGMRRGGHAGDQRHRPRRDRARPGRSRRPSCPSSGCRCSAPGRSAPPCRRRSRRRASRQVSGRGAGMTTGGRSAWRRAGGWACRRAPDSSAARMVCVSASRPTAALARRERPDLRLDDRVAPRRAASRRCAASPGARPHVAVHRRRDDDRRRRCEAGGGDDVVGEAGGHRRQPTGRGRRDEDHVGRVGGDDVARCADRAAARAGRSWAGGA